LSTEPFCVAINAVPSAPQVAHVVLVSSVEVFILKGVVDTDLDAPISPKRAEELVTAKNVELMETEVASRAKAATNKQPRDGGVLAPPSTSVDGWILSLLC
jgi:hypothetical protein